MFSRYDTNGDGSLDREEIRTAFADARVHVSNADVSHLLEMYDEDRDGTINYKEFRAMHDDIEKRLKRDASLDARAVMRTAAAHIETATRRTASGSWDAPEPPGGGAGPAGGGEGG